MLAAYCGFFLQYLRVLSAESERDLIRALPAKLNPVQRDRKATCVVELICEIQNVHLNRVVPGSYLKAARQHGIQPCITWQFKIIAVVAVSDADCKDAGSGVPSLAQGLVQP